MAPAHRQGPLGSEVINPPGRGKKEINKQTNIPLSQTAFSLAAPWYHSPVVLWQTPLLA